MPCNILINSLVFGSPLPLPKSENTGEGALLSLSLTLDSPNLLILELSVLALSSLSPAPHPVLLVPQYHSLIIKLLPTPESLLHSIGKLPTLGRTLPHPTGLPRSTLSSQD